MPRGLGRLPFLHRRVDRSEPSEPAPARPPVDPDAAPIGPPVLLPAAIIRQVLYEATELVPAWAMPRPSSLFAAAGAVSGGGAASIEAPAKPKRTRRTKPADAAAAAGEPSATPSPSARRAARPRKRPAAD